MLETYVGHVPDSATAWFRLGDSLRDIGRMVAAESALLKARQLVPADSLWAVDARLGMLYERKGSRKRAEMAYRRATSSQDCAGWVWILRGINQFNLEQIDSAKNCFTRALASNNVDKDEAHLNLGLLARHVGDYAEAVRCANAALEIDPTYTPARQLLTSIESGEKAREFLQKGNYRRGST